ncbi:translation initiation factor IF-2 [Populus alba x Populus x berolinensis]|nr:translation initiation factor IF-2 [Populus alba x Populus x berolinensis]
MRGTTIGRRIYNPCNFLTNPTSNHAPTFLSSSPFSTSSGRGRGAGNVGSPPGGQSEYGAVSPGKPDLDESKTESSESQPSGLGHGRGKPVSTGPILPAFSTFISSVKNSQPGAGRGRGTTEPGPSRPTESRPESEPPKMAEANLPSSILSGLGGAGRGKPVKQEVPGEPAKEENRHLRARSQPRSQPRTRLQKTPDGDDAVPATKKMGRQEAVKKAMELLSRGGGEGEVGGRGGGRGSFVPGRGGGRGGARGGGRDRGRGRGRGRRGYGDKEVEYGSGMSLEGHEEDEEKFAQSVGVETMNTLVEAFEEMSGRVLPCPMEDEYVDAFDTNCSFEFEPEYLMGEFDKNPDIDEKPPMPLRDALEKVKPFMMAYMGIKTHEEWEEIVEETMKDAPLMKKIVDSYSGPDRVSGKKQKEELERVAKTIPASAPDSVKSFADRAVLSLQSNPGWGFDKKCMFMDKLAKEVSQHYK